VRYYENDAATEFKLWSIREFHETILGTILNKVIVFVSLNIVYTLFQLLPAIAKKESLKKIVF